MAFGNSSVPSKLRLNPDMRRTSPAQREPLRDPAVARLAADTVRKAHAVGLIQECPDFPELTFASVLDVAGRLRRSGIAEHATIQLATVAPSDTREMARLLEEIDALIEQSPLPDSEWPHLMEVLGGEDLAGLLGISVSSASRYAQGQRRTPDDVAARLHFLALVVGDLAGAYNEIGVRRWFRRARTALEGKAPAQLLGRGWDPDDARAQRVRALARSLVTSPGA